MSVSAGARKFGRLAVVALVAIGAWAGCDDGSQPPPATTGTVTLLFDHAVAGDSLVLHVQRYTNAAGNLYDVNELRYYVSDAKLVRSDGSAVAVGDVHYRDAAVTTTRAWVLSNVPNGEYVKLRFTFGLDSLRNVTGGLPVTFESGLMSWPEPFGGGYHFMQLDGRHHDGTTGWQAHLGRLHRTVDPVAIDPHFEVELDFLAALCPDCHPDCGAPCSVPAHGLIVDSAAAEARIVMDVNAWFAAPNVYDFDFFGGAVMDNPAAQRQLGENGVHVFALRGAAGAKP